MARHQDLTGRGAIHPFAFGGATDPALDAGNEVAAFKAWIDETDPGAPVLKIRNATNTAWVSVINPNPPPEGFVVRWVSFTSRWDTLSLESQFSMTSRQWTKVDYV